MRVALGGAERVNRLAHHAELRDKVRAWMLAHCGEPDLANRNPLRDLIERRTGTGN